MINVEIPIRAMSINRCWQGKRYRTSEFKKWQEAVYYLLPYQPAIKGNVSIELDFWVKSPLRMDLDNLIKATLDCLVEKNYIDDDRYIFELKCRKFKGPEKIGIKIKQFNQPKP